MCLLLLIGAWAAAGYLYRTCHPRALPLFLVLSSEVTLVLTALVPETPYDQPYIPHL
jgi:hypothetical protein